MKTNIKLAIFNKIYSEKKKTIIYTNLFKKFTLVNLVINVGLVTHDGIVGERGGVRKVDIVVVGRVLASCAAVGRALVHRCHHPMKSPTVYRLDRHYLYVLLVYPFVGDF